MMKVSGIKRGAKIVITKMLILINKCLRYIEYRKKRQLWLGSHGNIVEYDFSPSGTSIKVKETPENLRRWKRVLQNDKKEAYKLLRGL